MKNILAKYVSFLLSLTALGLICSVVSAKAEPTSPTTPMYATYTDNSSKSVAQAGQSDLASQPSANTKPSVDNGETPAQQVVDRLGDSSETRSPETTEQVANVQQQQPKGTSAKPQGSAQQARLRSIPKSPVASSHSVARHTVSKTAGMKPKPQTPVAVVNKSTATQVSAVPVTAIANAQTSVVADTSTANQAAVVPARAMPMAKSQKPIAAANAPATAQPVPGTTMTSAAGLTQQPSTAPLPQTQAQNVGSQVAQTDITPGRATRSGSSYIGVAGNIGIVGSGSALGDSNFAVLSKIGLTRNFSFRPAFIFGDNTAILLPVTLDFPIGQTDPFQNFSFAPYAGGGVAVSTNGNVGFLLTGGIDVPLSREFTATASLNASFKGNPDLGLLLGIGYNFTGF